MRPRRGYRLVGRLLTAFLIATSATPAMAIEEPDYRIVRTVEDIEIRDYAPYVVAEIEVPGPASEAGGQAFPVLAAYIFGKNKGERKMEMTAPVAQTATPTSGVQPAASVKLEMTAPVTQVAQATGYVVQFVLPKSVTLASAPAPDDPRIHVRATAAARVAVIRYSGFWSEANYDEHLARLRAVLAANGLEATGEPVYARYDAPFKPWFLRRNEIWLPVGASRSPG